VDSIALAPGGIISKVYPEKKNRVKGKNVLQDPKYRDILIYSRDNNVTVISNPIQVDEGILALVIAEPIYRKHVSGGGNFWGFALTVLNVPKAFGNSALNRLRSEGYEYKLYTCGVNGDNTVVAQSSGEELISPVEVTFPVCGKFCWMLKLEPVYGWKDTDQQHWMGFISFILGILGGTAVCLLLVLGENERIFKELSYRDGLTGIWNHRSFERKAGELQKKNRPFGIIYLDVNGFKSVNDKYGHLVGDDLLVTVAGRLGDCLSDYEEVYRMGGDEFVILAQGSHNKEWYKSLIEELKCSVRHPVDVEGNSVFVDVSAGFAVYPEDGHDITALVRIADDNMYREKRGERVTVRRLQTREQ
jgi:diguanylate cyclase (GGDEF)-like protein